MTDLIQKDPQKGTVLNNYRSISCLPVWKIDLGGDLFLTSKLQTEEQKGCHKETRRTGDLLYIDQHILKDHKTRQKNVAMA